MINFITYLILTYASPNYNVVEAEQLAIEIIEVSKLYGISPVLVSSLIKEESGFDDTVTNRKTKARGLLQVLPRVWGRTTDRLDSIDKGLTVLSYYIDKCGNITRAVAAYRSGDCHKVGPKTKRVMIQYKKWSRLNERFSL